MFDRMVREPERFAMTGLPRTTWWELEQAGKAPKRLQLTTRVCAWKESELRAWLDSRERGCAPPPTAAMKARGIEVAG